jgi:cytochrome c biogenesis protein CcmG/thiol:disulfide interchange protein DsbE
MVALAACTGDPEQPTPSVALPTSVTELPNADVETFRALLDELRGTPVVVNLWASWCEPCQREMPMLAAATEAHRDVQFLGVDTLDAREGAEEFIAEFGVPFPSLFDPDGVIRTDLDSFGLPVTVFFDAEGNQVGKVDGELSQATLDEHLAAIAG